ncbi:hypothetical protein F5141DRAFT_1200594 [Pisolithus sp. B1]|nr:hypothetical protein F5141DRAFT_1200594 [Pisolithus sp. B1]
MASCFPLSSFAVGLLSWFFVQVKKIYPLQITTLFHDQSAQRYFIPPPGFSQSYGGRTDAIEDSLKRCGASVHGMHLEGSIYGLRWIAEALISRLLAWRTH